MKKTVLLIMSSLMAVALQAQTVSEQQARQTAAEFYQAHGANKAYEAPHQELYVFNNPEETGFVIVAGKETSTPILGWSDNGPFDYDKAPCALKALLEQYAEGIRRYEGAETPRTAAPSKNAPRKSETNAARGPLLTTQWSQWEPYNGQCPVITKSHYDWDNMLDTYSEGNYTEQQG